ncbi:EpsG family protein [Mangrovibacillus sp. Mu-81]|uniref:EpsG family protein n=1 Tax=Mangrovibacillus sp. Mu-81 TaxID=3121478 RepID=UPI002FE4CFB4
MFIYLFIGTIIFFYWIFNIPYIGRFNSKKYYLTTLNEFFLRCLYCILLIIAVTRGVEVGTDYTLYYNFFYNKLFNENFDTFVIWIYSVAHHFEEFRIFTLITSFLFLFIFYLIQKNYSYDKVTFTTLFVISYLYYFSFNGIRQALAMGFLWLGIMILRSNKVKSYIYFLLFVFVAAQFHISAYLGVFFVFINKINLRINYIWFGFIFTSIGYFTPILKERISTLLMNFDFYVNKYSNNLEFFFESSKEKGIIEYMPVVIQFSFFILWMIIKHRKQLQGTNIIENYYFIYLLLYSAAGIEAVDRFQVYFYPSIIFFYDMFIFHVLKHFVKTKREVFIGYIIAISIMLFWFSYYILRIVQNTNGIVPFSTWDL